MFERACFRLASPPGESRDPKEYRPAPCLQSSKVEEKPSASASVISAGRIVAFGRFAFKSALALGNSPKCRGSSLCRNRRKARAVGKGCSACRSGSSPFESTTSMSTGTCRSLRGDHAGKKKAGELIGHHSAGVRCQSGEQSFTGIRFRLQVRIVAERPCPQASRHSLPFHRVRTGVSDRSPRDTRSATLPRQPTASAAFRSTPRLDPAQNSRSSCWRQSSSREQNLHLAGLARSCRS